LTAAASRVKLVGDKETIMKELPPMSLKLEVEEIESREKHGGCSTSSTTSPHCTCPCRPPMTIDCAPTK
jgi:hypothetical protein